MTPRLAYGHLSLSKAYWSKNLARKHPTQQHLPLPPGCFMAINVEHQPIQYLFFHYRVGFGKLQGFSANNNSINKKKTRTTPTNINNNNQHNHFNAAPNKSVGSCAWVDAVESMLFTVFTVFTCVAGRSYDVPPLCGKKLHRSCSLHTKDMCGTHMGHIWDTSKSQIQHYST